MKGNEAPEKIYVHIPDDDIVGTASIQKGVPHEFVTKEYIRADVFMEKACDAFCKVRCKGKPPRNTCTSLGTCREHDDFKKTMRG
jgi:hypothetical protein